MNIVQMDMAGITLGLGIVLQAAQEEKGHKPPQIGRLAMLYQ